MFEIIPYTNERKAEWDSFVANSKNGTFLFFRDYMEYHSDRFQDNSLMCYKKGKLWALLPANRQGEVLYSHQGLTYGGLIMGKKIVTTEVLALFVSLCDYLSAQQVSYIIYKVMPHIYHRVPAEEDLYALFHGNKKVELFERRVSSVLVADNKIPFSTLRRRKVALARKTLLRLENDNMWDCFWPVLEHNLKERHTASPVHSLAEIKWLHHLFPNNIQLYRVTNGNDTVGGCVMYVTDGVAHVQYIASTEEGRRMGALDLLFDYLIHDRYGKMPYFDLGTSVENGGKYLNEGLIFQKEGFGGRAVVYDTYKINLK